MAYNTLMLLAQLSGLRILVLANRLGCDTELARTVHDRLAAKLAEMIDARWQSTGASPDVIFGIEAAGH